VLPPGVCMGDLRQRLRQAIDPGDLSTIGSDIPL
jgi:hypothetical protein